MTARGRGWAYAGAIVGGGVSVAANIAHSFRPPAAALPTWTPQPGAVLLAAFWPLALLLAVEVLVRVAWPRETRWTVLRFGGVTPVAVVAAVVSYRHLSGLLDWYGEDTVTVAIGPLAVDGLMLISTGALLALSTRSLDATGSRGSSESVESTATADRAEPPPSSYPTPVDVAAPAQIEPARVVALVSRAAPSTETTEVEPRAEDLARAQALITDGALPRRPSAEEVRKQLKIGPKYARAVRDTLSSQTSDQAEQEAKTSVE